MLNTLIENNNDRIEGYETASNETEEQDLKTLFAQLSQTIHKCKNEKKYIILISVVILLIIIRLILPYIVLHYANKTLANVNGYYGHIDDIDLSIYRGAYIINDIYLNKVDSAGISCVFVNF